MANKKVSSPNVVAAGIAADALKSYVQRIERLEGEKKDLAEDIKDIYAEAKSTGFDVKILRLVIKRRKLERHELEEAEALLDLYEHALANTPLEKYVRADKLKEDLAVAQNNVEKNKMN